MGFSRLPSDGASAPASRDAAPGVITPESLADRLVPNDPHVSPDGQRVVFVVSAGGREDEHPKRTLWLASEDNALRRLTGGMFDDSAPRWSPDGSRILFRSDRQRTEETSHRLCILPLTGGEAQPVGTIAGELSQPSWSPDGAFIAVLRQDPLPAAELARKKCRDDAIVVEEQPRYTRLWVIDAQRGSARCLTTGDREVRCYTWTADSASLVFVTTDASEFDAVMGPGDVWRVPLAGGLPGLVARFPTTPSSPVVVETTGGPMVVVRADGHREQPSDSVWRVPLCGGEPANCLPDLTGVVEEISRWGETRGAIAARVVERTRGRIYAVDVLTGAMTPLTPFPLAEDGSVLQGLSFSTTGERLAAIWSNAVTPEDVFLGTVNGDVSAVTSFGAAFTGRLQPTELVTWKSDDGVEIEGLLTYPAGYQPGTRYPLFVEIHGGPSWQWEDRVMLDWHDWAQLLASHGYAVLLPNPRGSTGYGHAFQRLLQDDIGGGESRDLISGALAMVERGIADGARLGIGGWSWGGYLTALTITRTDIFRAAIMGAGLANMVSDHGQGDIPSANLLYFPGQPYDHMEAYWRSSPIRDVSAVRTPTLILHGEEDARVHPAQGMEFFRALKTLGVPVRFVRYPREKHGIEERLHQIDLMQRVVDWLERYLKHPASLNGRESNPISSARDQASNRVMVSV